MSRCTAGQSSAASQFLDAAVGTLTHAHPLVLALCAIGVLAWVPWLINRCRFRRIPGPFAPPVLGNLLGIGALDMHGFIEQCARRHGSIFKMYIGSSMIVCVAEPAAAKRLLAKLSTRHIGVPMLAGSEDWDFLGVGLVGANGAAWHTLRTAWQPAFSPAALQGYLPAMDGCMDRLLARLAPAAASGQEVDLAQELSGMTLGMVGEAAYGVDLHAVQPPQQRADDGGSSSSSSGLLEVFQSVFAGGGVTNSSAWLVPVLLFPALAPLLQWLAFHFPDAKLRALAQARRAIRQVSLQLVHTWRPPANGQHSSQQPNGSSSDSSGAGPAPKQPPQQPGTFPHLLLAALDKETGQPLSDEVVVAQLNTFLVAAFETTASATAFAAYLVAQHPDVEARLLQELGRLPRGGKPEQPGRSSGCSAVTAEELAELPYLNAVVKEALRLLPPAAVATRITDAAGYQLTPQVWLPPGTALFACISCCQQDAGVWPLAREFRPERWLPEGADLHPSTPDAFMPFGAGARFCVGRPLAIQAVTLALLRLFSQYSLELQPGQVPLPLKQTFALVPAKGLRVRVHKRERL